MFTIRKTFKWEGAHRLESSYSKECQQIHGHSYKTEVIITASELNDDGMVIDFKKLKEIVGPIIDSWDHKNIIKDRCQAIDGIVFVNFNPTAENMSKYIWDEIESLIKKEIPSALWLIVRIHETDTGYAQFEGDL